MRYLRGLAVCVLLCTAASCDTKNIGGADYGGPGFWLQQAQHVGQAYPGATIELHMVYTGATNPIVQWELGDWADPPSVSYVAVTSYDHVVLRQPSNQYYSFESVRNVRVLDQHLTKPKEVEVSYKLLPGSTA